MNDNMNSNIVCPQCGMTNASNTKFCIKRGTGLQPDAMEVPQVATVEVEQNVTPVASQETFNNNVTSQFNNVQQPIYNNVSTNVQPSTTATGKFNFFQYIIGAVLKPFDRFKKDEENLSSFKNVGILSLIVVGFMTIIGLITTMINTVRVTSFWTDEVEWVWENLKEIEYFKVIGQSLLIYAGVLLAISGIYFLASLVIKKEAKFPKLLGATVTAFIPFAIATSILSPLLSLIYSPLGLVVTIVGFIYTLVILLELMNELIKIENKNTRIYFHLTCLSILIIGGGFIAYKLILGSLSSGLGGLSSLFG